MLQNITKKELKAKVVPRCKKNLEVRMEFGVSLEFERRLHPVGVCDCIMSSLSVHFFSLLLEGASNSGPAALPFVFLIV